MTARFERDVRVGRAGESSETGVWERDLVEEEMEDVDWAAERRAEVDRRGMTGEASDEEGGVEGTTDTAASFLPARRRGRATTSSEEVDDLADDEVVDVDGLILLGRMPLFSS